MTKPKPWEHGDNPNKIVAPVKPRRARKPASEAHKRGLADDYRNAPEEARATLLKQIVGAEWNHYYKGRTGLLDEIADQTYTYAIEGHYADDLEKILGIIRDELQARKDGAALLNKDTAPGVRAGLIASAYRKSLGKTFAIRLPIVKEETMKREVTPAQAPLETPGHVTGGLFGNKLPDGDKVTQATQLAGEIAELNDNIDDLIPRPPASEPAAVVDDKPVCLNDWANRPKALKAYQDRVEYIASEAGIAMKDARAWGLNIHHVPDEMQIAMSVPEALAVIRTELPTSIDEQVEAAHEQDERMMQASQPLAVEITEKKVSEPIVSNSSEASVIIFAKSDVCLTLPDGSTVALSVTLRDGADFSEVKRLLDVYAQMLTLPNVSAARPQPAAVNTPAIPAPSAPRPAAQTSAPQNTSAERISKVISGIKVAFNEKGVKTLQLYGKYGDNWGTGPDHTSRKPEEIAAVAQIADVNIDALQAGEISAVVPFTVSWVKGKETSAGSGRYYHDDPKFTR